VLFAHSVKFPEIVGLAFTVTVIVAVQPRLFVYVMFAVPAETPITEPFEFTVAMDGLPETQGLVLFGVPVPVKGSDAPTQIVLFPAIVGRVFTVTVMVAVLAH
jgi:hypothetical protein